MASAIALWLSCSQVVWSLRVCCVAESLRVFCCTTSYSHTWSASIHPKPYIFVCRGWPSCMARPKGMASILDSCQLLFRQHLLWGIAEGSWSCCARQCSTTELVVSSELLSMQNLECEAQLYRSSEIMPKDPMQFASVCVDRSLWNMCLADYWPHVYTHPNLDLGIFDSADTGVAPVLLTLLVLTQLTHLILWAKLLKCMLRTPSLLSKIVPRIGASLTVSGVTVQMWADCGAYWQGHQELASPWVPVLMQVT